LAPFGKYALCHLNFFALQFRHYSYFTDEGEKNSQKQLETRSSLHMQIVELGISFVFVVKEH
jgi:hypothetical protein